LKFSQTKDEGQINSGASHRTLPARLELEVVAVVESTSEKVVARSFDYTTGLLNWDVVAVGTIRGSALRRLSHCQAKYTK
jgi:hypothetical protein